LVSVRLAVAFFFACMCALAWGPDWLAASITAFLVVVFVVWFVLAVVAAWDPRRSL
jgi:hypothetical protein